MTWITEATEVKTAADKQAEAAQAQIDQFKRERAEALQSAVVTTTAGNQFDADEQSIGRMGFRIQRAELSGDTTVGWVLADSPAGVKTEVTIDELKEAFQLAVDNMDAQWGQLAE